MLVKCLVRERDLLEVTISLDILLDRIEINFQILNELLNREDVGANYYQKNVLLAYLAIFNLIDPKSLGEEPLKIYKLLREMMGKRGIKEKEIRRMLRKYGLDEDYLDVLTDTLGYNPARDIYFFLPTGVLEPIYERAVRLGKYSL